MSDDKNFKELKVVCLGTVVGRGDKRLTAIQLVDSTLNVYGAKAYFSGMKKFHVAGIFTVNVELDADKEISIIQGSTARFFCAFPDEEQSALMRLSHETNETLITAAAQSKKARNDKTCVLETLRPLRKLWASTNHAGQLALEVRVLNYLRNGTDL